MKLVWLSDIHLKPEGKLLYGYDPIQRLSHAVDYIITEHADADYCFISGDLVDEADALSYQTIKKLIAGLSMPVLTIPGNHDDRNLMRQYFSFPGNCHADFLQYSVKNKNCRIIALDTLYDGQAQGLLCEDRLDWLQAELASDTQSATVVFCHHHPLALQLPMQDRETLVNGEVLLKMLTDAANVKHLFFGHIHRPVSGSFNNLGFTALQSVSLQAPLPYPSWDWDSFCPAHEPPALGIIHLSENSVVTHFHAFCNPKDYFYPQV